MRIDFLAALLLFVTCLSPSNGRAQSTAGLSARGTGRALGPPSFSVEEFEESERVRPRAPYFALRLGTGGALLLNERQQLAASMLTVGVVLRHRWFEGALALEGMALAESMGTSGDFGTELQPQFRACINSGVAIPIDSSALHVGGAMCLGAGEMRNFHRSIDSSPENELGVYSSAGPYLGFSFRLSQSMRLQLRSIFEGAIHGASSHFGYLQPAFTASLTIH